MMKLNNEAKVVLTQGCSRWVYNFTNVTSDLDYDAEHTSIRSWEGLLVKNYLTDYTYTHKLVSHDPFTIAKEWFMNKKILREVAKRAIEAEYDPSKVYDYGDELVRLLKEMPEGPEKEELRTKIDNYVQELMDNASVRIEVTLKPTAKEQKKLDKKQAKEDAKDGYYPDGI